MSRLTGRDFARSDMLAVFNDYMAYCRGTQSMVNTALSLAVEQDRRVHMFINRMFPYVPSSLLPPASSPPRQQHRARAFGDTPPRGSEPVDTVFAQGESFSPVIIRPSEEHIVAATHVYLFREMEAPINTTCPITQTRFLADDLVMQITHCGHNFCPEALRDWFERDVRCPLCRYDIRGPGGAMQAGANAQTPNAATESPLRGTISAASREELAARIGRLVATDFMDRVAPSIAQPGGGSPINMTYSFMSSLGGMASLHSPPSPGDPSDGGSDTPPHGAPHGAPHDEVSM